jgi:hypothetical protein
MSGRGKGKTAGKKSVTKSTKAGGILLTIDNDRIVSLCLYGCSVDVWRAWPARPEVLFSNSVVTQPVGPEEMLYGTHNLTSNAVGM